MGIESIASNLLSPSTISSIASNLGSIGGISLFGVDDFVEKLSKLDLQLPTRWEFTIARIPQFDVQSGNSLSQNLTGLATGALQTGGAIVDALVTQLYVQSVSVPHLAIEYEKASGSKKYVIGTTAPETVEITFIEDEAGTVTRWLEEWYRNILIKDPTVGDVKTITQGANVSTVPDAQSMESSINLGYVFKSNQEAAKRRGTLQMKPSSNIPGTDDGSDLGGAIGGLGSSALSAFGIQSNALQGLGSVAGRVASGGNVLQFPTYILNGLRPLSRGNLDTNQDGTESLRITCTFSVETVEIIFFS